MNEQNSSGQYVNKNLVTEDANLRKDGLYHTKTDGMTLRDYYYQQELIDYTPNIEKLEELNSKLAKIKEYLLGTPSKKGIIDQIKEIKDNLEARSQLLDPEILKQIDPEFKKLESELQSFENERDKLVADMNSVQEDIDFIEEANKRHAEHNKQVTIDFHDDEIAKLKAIKAEKEKVLREIEMLKKAAYDTHREDFYGAFAYENSSINTKLKNQLADKEKELEILEAQERELSMKLRSVGLNAREVTTEQKKEETVTVSFDLAGGNNDAYDYSPVTFTKGDPCMRPDVDPQLDDEHVFDCWTLNGDPFDFTQPVNENITLTAKYKELHKVTYFDKKGNKLETITVPHGEKISNLKTLPDKKFTLFDGWKMSDGEKFDPEMEITEDMDLTAAYKKDWKKVAAIGAGVAIGGVTLAADLMLGTGGWISHAATAGLGLVTTAVNYKLKNHKTEMIDTQNLKGIKKGGAKLINYFRDEKNLKNLRLFCRTATLSTAIAGLGVRIGNGIKNMGGGKPGDEPEPEPDPEDNDKTLKDELETDKDLDTPETVDEHFSNKGTPNAINDTALGSQQGTNMETPLAEFVGSQPTRAYSPSTGEWMNITSTTTMDDVIKTLGPDAQFDFTKGEISMGWVDPVNSYGGMTR